MLLLHPGFFFWQQQGFVTECKGKVAQVFYQVDTDATCFCLAFHYSTLGKLTRNKWTHLFQPNWWCSWSMLLAISLISFMPYKSGKVDLLCQQLLLCYSKKKNDIWFAIFYIIIVSVYIIIMAQCWWQQNTFFFCCNNIRAVYWSNPEREMAALHFLATNSFGISRLFSLTV